MSVLISAFSFCISNICTHKVIPISRKKRKIFGQKFYISATKASFDTGWPRCLKPVYLNTFPISFVLE